MIYLYSGTPGSGKSLHVARDIRDALLYKRRPVVCNFDINSNLRNYASLFSYRPNSDLTPEFLYTYSRQHFAGRPVREDSILLVIDEAQLVFNSRTWQDRGASQRRMDSSASTAIMATRSCLSRSLIGCSIGRLDRL